ncbi:FadR/GntR family transcriptional regulator [Streptomyces sp. NPDC093970]|uniref:FadR/GntR family transcriptional regulator n=1 Tax=Streptomyces sp. NPDC093970 TaxID=3155076 RepID=UPI003420F987
MASRGWADIMVEFPTMHQRVVDQLGRRIVGGGWRPGDTLPVEDVLAAEVGVSRGVLREAVKALVAKGMLHVRPRTGTRVLPPRQWNHLDREVLRWKQAENATALLRDTGELRRVVEPEAARLAAGRATPDDVRALYGHVAAMEAAAAEPGGTGYIEADIAFHQALLDASGNPLLGSLGRAVDVALEHSFLVSTRTPGAVEASLPGHRAIVQAVEARDGAAAAAAVLALIEAAERDIAQSPVKGSAANRHDTWTT